MLAALGLGGGLVNAMANPTNPYYQGPVSDHFDGLRFFNPQGTPPGSLRDLLRWRWQGERAVWPTSVPVAQPFMPQPRVDDLTITMVGHATMLVQTQGMNILTDPVWSDRASPVSFAGPRRVTAPGIAFDDLPPIDAVLLSHSHYDHLDLPTLHRLKAAHDPLVIAPLGNEAILAGTGLTTRTGDWGDVLETGALRVHLVPCHHWSARGMRDRSMALWAGFVVTGRAPGCMSAIPGLTAGAPTATCPRALARCARPSCRSAPTNHAGSCRASTRTQTRRCRAFAWPGPGLRLGIIGAHSN